jgi:hypothetical protein
MAFGVSSAMLLVLYLRLEGIPDEPKCAVVVAGVILALVLAGWTWVHADLEDDAMQVSTAPCSDKNE